MPVKMGCKI